MCIFSLLFLCGALLLQLFSSLPALAWAEGITLATLLVNLIFKKQWNYFKFPTALALGFAWSVWYAHPGWILASDLESKPLLLRGYIQSIPELSAYRTTFLFSLKQNHALIHLSWQGDHPLRVGDEWLFTVRLKKIHGTLNPGGFDYEAWAFQEGIQASGYVVEKAKNKKLTSHFYHNFLGRLRQKLKEKIEANLPPSNTSPWIIALALGERQGIKAENWQVLRNTGTNHLMAIAGLHIGFMAAFAYAVISWIWRRIHFLALMLPAQQAGAIAALVVGLIYSAMAGFSIPTQRACIMLAVFLGVLLLRRKTSGWHVWGFAMLCVLLINPLSVLTESFWLSFGSVALIIYGVSGRLAPKGWWWKWGRIQWVIALGLVPLSMGLFQQCSLISFIANSIAIPCVGFCIVPLTLLGCFLLVFSAHTGGWILLLADKLLSLLWAVLTYLSHLSFAVWYGAPSHGILIAAAVGVIILLFPIGFPGRFLGIVWLLPLIFYKPLTPKVGEVWFSLLDVGQGLSAVVQTQHHILVFDTGAKLGENFDMGDSVVLPFLRTLGIKQIDQLVISHGDNDHIGGAGALIQQLPVLSIKTSVPERFSIPHVEYCLQGQQWNWDHVHFKFLYPTLDHLHLGNDSSCVLRITAGKHSILLTGDIEKVAEKYLTKVEEKNLAADILVAPHHGSKTSAMNNFVEAVHPRIVLFPLGYCNRYHFPHPSVVRKYKNSEALLYDSANDGAIQFKLDENKPLALPSLYRIQHTHYWNS